METYLLGFWKNLLGSPALRGEWSWFKTQGGFVYSETDNKFTSIVKILSFNADTSINYEVIVEDTLYYKGSFQIQPSSGSWPYRRINIRLPHPIPEDNRYNPLKYSILPENPNKEILTFFDGCIDGYRYVYEKIR